MRRRFPGTSQYIRIMEPVATVDGQYDIFDTGIEHEDGTIDSIAIGGSFSFLKQQIKKADEAAAANKAEAQPAKKTVTVVAEPVAA